MPLRCYIGRVVEKKSIEAHGQQFQKAWPSAQNKSTQRGLPRPRNYNRTELQHKAYSVKTGSAKIHALSGHGRATYGSATAISSERGYAEWPRAGMQDRNYVILHREVDDPDAETPISKWCVSSVTEAAIQDGDIVLALVSGWKTVHQIWKSDVMYTPEQTPTDPEPPDPDPDPDPPVVNPDGTLTIKAMMVNNLVPEIFGVLLTETPLQTLPLNYQDGYSYVYLKVGCDNSVLPHRYPVADRASQYYPEIISSGTQLTSTDEYGYILLAVVKQGEVPTVFSLVDKSLWSDRIKVANATATYFFSRV